MTTDPYTVWSAGALAYRDQLESLFCPHHATPYSAHTENNRVGFGWPKGETKHHILALAEDKPDQGAFLIRLTVGPDHGLVKSGSPFITPPTGNKKDVEERVDCIVSYQSPLPKGFREAVEMAFNYMLENPKLSHYRDQ